jgi:hypothetical protein
VAQQYTTHACVDTCASYSTAAGCQVRTRKTLSSCLSVFIVVFTQDMPRTPATFNLGTN